MIREDEEGATAPVSDAGQAHRTTEGGTREAVYKINIQLRSVGDNTEIEGHHSDVVKKFFDEFDISPERQKEILEAIVRFNELGMKLAGEYLNPTIRLDDSQKIPEMSRERVQELVNKIIPAMRHRRLLDLFLAKNYLSTAKYSEEKEKVIEELGYSKDKNPEKEPAETPGNVPGRGWVWTDQ